jgi:hypothetical protein
LIELESSPPSPRGSRLISRILPPALRLWLSSQVEHVEDLTFQIQGRDRELLSGHIPEVFLSAHRAIYQGIHLSQIAVKAQEIRINLPQVLRRQPLRLLAPFPVSGDLLLTEADLNASLASQLLGEGLYDFLSRLAAAQPEADEFRSFLTHCEGATLLSLYEPQATILEAAMTLRLSPRPGTSAPEIAIATGLAIADGHRLCLKDPHWLHPLNPAKPLPTLHGFEIDLGSEVSLTQCILTPGQMALAGTVQVLP